MVHGGVDTGRRKAERDLSIYFDYLDGLTPKYLAKKHGITRGRIYQIIKKMDKESERMI
jgi:Mor family transcriptional regulator